MPEVQQPVTPQQPDSRAPQAHGGPSVAPPPAAEELEFKPIVKYAGIGLAFLLLIGVEYATYNLGHNRGYLQGTASGAVQSSVNETAVQNLTHFMQTAAADDATLLAMVQHHGTELAWIKDESIRREAEWTLAQALMDRGLVAQGKELLSFLMTSAPQNTIWAQRAAQVAKAMAAASLEEEAIAYYRLAADTYSSLDKQGEQLEILSAMVELLAASSSPATEVIASLETLQQEAADIGDAGKALRSSILAYMGGLYRRTGDRANALRCFGQALSGMEVGQTPEMASAAVSYGMALLEQGETEKAEVLLRSSVARLGDNPVDTPFLVSALRELALIEQDRGHPDVALGMLYRAEGAASGRIPADNPFWPYLFDQRGWLNLLMQLHESALNDFCKALEYNSRPELLIQPLEGAGRCSITLGKKEQAVEYLTRAVELRKQYLPDAKADLGRVYLFLGQAHDMGGDPEPSCEAYLHAIELIPQEENDYKFALMSLGYCNIQMQKWEDALRIWTQLHTLFQDDPIRRTEARVQIEYCKHGGSVDAPDFHDDAEEGEEEWSARPALHRRPATVRRSSTKRRR